MTIFSLFNIMDMGTKNLATQNTQSLFILFDVEAFTYCYSEIQWLLKDRSLKLSSSVNQASPKDRKPFLFEDQQQMSLSY